MRKALSLGAIGLVIALGGCTDIGTIPVVRSSGGGGSALVLSADISGDFAGARNFETERVPSASIQSWGDMIEIRVDVDNPSARQFGMHAVRVSGVSQLEVGESYEFISGSDIYLQTCSGGEPGSRLSNEEGTPEVDLEVIAGSDPDTAEVVWTARLDGGRETTGIARFDAPGGIVDID